MERGVVLCSSPLQVWRWEAQAEKLTENPPQSEQAEEQAEQADHVSIDDDFVTKNCSCCSCGEEETTTTSLGSKEDVTTSSPTTFAFASSPTTFVFAEEVLISVRGKRVQKMERSARNHNTSRAEGEEGGREEKKADEADQIWSLAADAENALNRKYISEDASAQALNSKEFNAVSFIKERREIDRKISFLEKEKSSPSCTREKLLFAIGRRVRKRERKKEEKNKAVETEKLERLTAQPEEWNFENFKAFLETNTKVSSPSMTMSPDILSSPGSACSSPSSSGGASSGGGVGAGELVLTGLPPDMAPPSSPCKSSSPASEKKPEKPEEDEMAKLAQKFASAIPKEVSMREVMLITSSISPPPPPEEEAQEKDGSGVILRGKENLLLEMLRTQPGLAERLVKPWIDLFQRKGPAAAMISISKQGGGTMKHLNVSKNQNLNPGSARSSVASFYTARGPMGSRSHCTTRDATSFVTARDGGSTTTLTGINGMMNEEELAEDLEKFRNKVRLSEARLATLAENEKSNAAKPWHPFTKSRLTIDGRIDEADDRDDRDDLETISYSSGSEVEDEKDEKKKKGKQQNRETKIRVNTKKDCSRSLIEDEAFMADRMDELDTFIVEEGARGKRSVIQWKGDKELFPATASTSSTSNAGGAGGGGGSSSYTRRSTVIGGRNITNQSAPTIILKKRRNTVVNRSKLGDGVISLAEFVGSIGASSSSSRRKKHEMNVNGGLTTTTTNGVGSAVASVKSDRLEPPTRTTPTRNASSSGKRHSNTTSSGSQRTGITPSTCGGDESENDLFFGNQVSKVALELPGAERIEMSEESEMSQLSSSSQSLHAGEGSEESESGSESESSSEYSSSGSGSSTASSEGSSEEEDESSVADGSVSEEESADEISTLHPPPLEEVEEEVGESEEEEVPHFANEVPPAVETSIPSFWNPSFGEFSRTTNSIITGVGGEKENIFKGGSVLSAEVTAGVRSSIRSLRMELRTPQVTRTTRISIRFLISFGNPSRYA